MKEGYENAYIEESNIQRSTPKDFFLLYFHWTFTIV